jgi:hypothetical protein
MRSSSTTRKRLADSVQGPRPCEELHLRRRDRVSSTRLGSPNPTPKVPNNEGVTIHPDSVNSDGTGVVILVSKSDTAPSKSGTLSQICSSLPARSWRATRGTGNNFDGAATGQGLKSHPQLRDEQRNAGAASATRRDLGGGSPWIGGTSVTNLSPPYFVNDDHDCVVSVTAKVDFGVSTTRPMATRLENRIRAATARKSAVWLGRVQTETSRRGQARSRFRLPDGPQVVNLDYFDKTSGNNCNNQNANQGTFGTRPCRTRLTTHRDRSGT